MNTLAMLGTSRADGNTRRALDAVLGDRMVHVIDLAMLAITPFDYAHENSDDAFLSLAERLVRADLLILATPVYWYSMSAQMKAFLDRWSDLVTVRKDLGRALAGRRLCVVVSSRSRDLPDGFSVPFELTARYFELQWEGCCHVQFLGDGVPSPEALGVARSFGDRVLGRRTREEE